MTIKLTPEIFEILAKQSAIYHYTTSKVALENILPYARLRMTPLAYTNDPREYKELHLSSVGWGDYNDSEKRIPQAQALLDKIRREKYQMVAFSKNNNLLYNNQKQSTLNQYNYLGCCKPRMWSQYGESHQGVVLVFDSEVLTKSIRNQLLDDDKIYSKEIVYEHFNIRQNLILDSNKILETNIEDYCNNYLENNIESFFFVKSPDYKDENEYRVIVKSNGNTRIYINIKDSLIAVIVGDRFPDGLLPSLKYLCKKLNIDCKRIYWESGHAILIDCLPTDYQLYKAWHDL
jgi:hypothetical protein